MSWYESRMIVLGVILLILGLIFDAGIFWTIGLILILIVVGVILALLGMMGPRRRAETLLLVGSS
ncbi:MAG TPA: hypothetical protein VKA45_08755 [Gaiellaceae bacterium]|nr:hypothetical protein [Gaiellaceae bacterium]